jgi:hypothetical protein
VSVTKVTDTVLYLGLAIGPTGDHFVCTNPKCGVERIYGDNGVVLVKRVEEEKA